MILVKAKKGPSRSLMQEEAARGKQPPPWTARLSHALLRREAEGLLKTPSR
jgi:hypothetical protein